MSCSGMRVFQKPQWFIKFKGQNLETNQEVITDLKTLNKQLVVVTAIGSLRTGKSWMLNRLAECEPEKGFTVLDGQSSVTKGIWIYCREHPRKNNCIIVFLDTEGLNDPLEDDSKNKDNRLFTVAFHLCNVLIYNVSKKLDNNDLEKVGFITHISEKLQRSETNTTYPDFILLVRDVEKLKVDGNVLAPDEYLNRVLTSGGEKHSLNLSPRTCILQNFKNRRCFSMTLPVDFDDLDTLHQGRVPLRKKYLEDECVLKQYVLEGVDVKRLSSGSPCTVKVFCGTIPAIVQKVEDGDIPVVTSILQSVAREENELLQNEVKERFEASLCDESTNELYASYKEKSSVLKITCSKELVKNIVPVDEEDLQQYLNGFENFAEDRVNAVFSRKCQAERDACLDPILKSGFANKYRPPNCEKHFLIDIETGYRKYQTNLYYYSHKNVELFWKQRDNEIVICREFLKQCDSTWQKEETERKQRKQIEQQRLQQRRMEEELRRLERQNREQRIQQGVELTVQILSGALNIGLTLANIFRR